MIRCPDKLRAVLREMILSDPEREDGASRTDEIIDMGWPRLRAILEGEIAAETRLRARRLLNRGPAEHAPIKPRDSPRPTDAARRMLSGFAQETHLR